jgi:hypothetical protein
MSAAFDIQRGKLSLLGILATGIRRRSLAHQLAHLVVVIRIQVGMQMARSKILLCDRLGAVLFLKTNAKKLRYSSQYFGNNRSSVKRDTPCSSETSPRRCDRQDENTANAVHGEHPREFQKRPSVDMGNHEKGSTTRLRQQASHHKAIKTHSALRYSPPSCDRPSYLVPDRANESFLASTFHHH